jgi:site-specific DNA recombinase
VDRAARLVVSEEEIDGLGMSEAGVVRQMFAMSANDGATCIEIAKRLNDLRVPTTYTRDGREVLRGKRREKTSGLWSSSRVYNMLIETTYKGIHTWGKRGSKNRVKGAEHTTIERAVPAIVDADTWQRAQVTLRNNALSRPDVERRKYLLRGLIKCSECGRTFIGSVSQGRLASRLSPEELEGAEVRDGLVLRPYYMCAGKIATHRKSLETGKLSPKCTSGHLRGVEAEAAVWEQVKEFIQSPDAILSELAAKLAERGGDAALVEAELARIEAEVAERDAQRAMLFRLFRKGSMSESDLERQLAETVEEEKVLNDEAERLRGAAKLAGGAKATLNAVRGFLGRLEAKLAAEDGEPGWATKRRLIEALVERIGISSQVDPSDTRGRRRVHTLRIKYNFEDPRPTKTQSGLVLEKEMLFGGTYMSLQRDTNAALVQQVNAETPGMTLDELGAAMEQKHGLKLSRASLCRLRAKVGQAPDTRQSRNGKAPRKKKSTAI